MIWFYVFSAWAWHNCSIDNALFNHNKNGPLSFDLKLKRCFWMYCLGRKSWQVRKKFHLLLYKKGTRICSYFIQVLILEKLKLSHGKEIYNKNIFGEKIVYSFLSNWNLYNVFTYRNLSWIYASFLTIGHMIGDPAWQKLRMHGNALNSVIWIMGIFIKVCLVFIISYIYFIMYIMYVNFKGMKYNKFG